MYVSNIPCPTEGLQTLAKIQKSSSEVVPSNQNFLPPPNLNFYQAPDHNYLQMLREFEAKLTGRGGHIEQSYTYLDSTSTLRWQDLVNQTDYLNFVEGGLPFHWAVNTIRSEWERFGLDMTQPVEVISLGCGDNRKETHLVEYLLEKIPGLKRLDFILLDISPALLFFGHETALKTFRDEPRVSIIPALGNMMHLNQYDKLLHRPEQAGRRRMIVMLGSTIGNLDNEVAFLKNDLNSFEPGTLLFVDFTSTFAPANATAEIFQKDPYLAGTATGKWVKALERFLIAPFEKSRKLYKKLSFQPRLDNRTVVIPESYAIELCVHITDQDDRESIFAMHRVKRYNAEAFVKTMSQVGWEAVDGKKFGTNQLVYLFCKE